MKKSKLKKQVMRLLKSHEVRDLNEALKLCDCKCHEIKHDYKNEFNPISCCTCQFMDPFKLGDMTIDTEKQIQEKINIIISESRYKNL